jgi:hypothetical protein
MQGEAERGCVASRLHSQINLISMQIRSTGDPQALGIGFRDLTG